MNARAARFAVLALAWLLAAAPVAHAQSLRAWLDRDRIALGETATLNIEIDGAATAEPSAGSATSTMSNRTVTGFVRKPAR